MKYQFFAAAIVNAVLVSQTNAWEQAYTWSSGLDQKTYEKQVQTYVTLATKAKNYVDKHAPPKSQEPITQPLNAVNTVLTCEACQGGFKLAQSLLRNEFMQQLVVNGGSDICWLLTSYITHDACALYVLQAAPSILDNLSDLLVSPEYSCEVELGYCNREWYELDTPENYANRVLKAKPEFLQNDNFLNFMYKEIAMDTKPRKTISLVQFTDLHIDLDYVPGSNKVCNNVLCCRLEDGMATDPAQAAGAYGSVAFCDVPVSVLDKMTEKVNELAPDTLFWTGDAVPHDQWNYSQEYVENYNTFLFNYMQKNLNQWRTFPLEGNHDFGAVINSQDFNSTDPIIPFLANYWKVWLDEAALQEFLVNGFYTQKFSTTDGTVYDKVNLIAINTEACYNANFYLMGNRQDPGDQLAWLEEKLNVMEANGEIAILIGHHPPASESSLYEWGTRFRILMDRFQHIVRLSFFGHVHTEEHNSIKSWTSNKTVGLNFWSGAMTTYSNAYPSFRRFILDAETMLPVQIETYRMDVEAENPEFILDHELKEYYGMADLSPASFDDLSERFLNDEALALKYQKTKSQQGNKGIESCDEKCRLEVYCDTQTSTYDDSRLCQGFVKRDWVHAPGTAVMETLMEPWYTYDRFPRK